MRSHLRFGVRRPVAAVVVAALAPAALTSGCGTAVGPLEPTAVTGRYALQAIDGRPLPVVFGAPGTIVFDTVTFAGDGTWTSRTGDGRVGVPGVVATAVYRGTWTLDGRARVLHYTAITVQNTRVSGEYRVGGNGATLTADTGDPTARVWTYARVP